MSEEVDSGPAELDVEPGGQGLDVVRKITLYGIAGRRRSPAATALLNLLRSADWPELIR